MTIEALIRSIVREEIARALAEDRGAKENLSVDQAAEIAHVVPATIRRWIREGHLSELRAGRRVLVPRGALERFLEDGAPDRSDSIEPELLARRMFG